MTRRRSSRLSTSYNELCGHDRGEHRAGRVRQQQLILEHVEQRHDQHLGRGREPRRGQAGDHDRRQELLRGEHPRRALRTGARSEGLQSHAQGQRRLDRDHLQGAAGRPGRPLPGVHRRAALGGRQQKTNPTSASAAAAEAKAFLEKNGATLLNTTPFYDSDALATLPSYATKHSLKSIADLKALGKGVKLGAAPEFATRQEGLLGLKSEYGFNPVFKPIAIELSYKALETGQVDVQDVFTTDAQLLGGKFKVLEDPKHVFGFQNVAPVVKQTVLAAEGPAFAETLNKLSALLTIPAIQQMNKAVSVDKQSAASVAKQFLAANGLG